MSRARSLLFVVASLTCFACTSALSSAEHYRDLGRDELAVLYYAANYHENPDEAAAKDELHKSFETALRNIGADYEDQVQGGHLRKALAAALRKEDALSFARSLGLREYAAMSAKSEIDAVGPRATREALAALDAAGEQSSKRELMALLREALAFDPNNGELAARYEREQRALLRNILPRVECDPESIQICEDFAGKVLMLMTRENREVTQIATPNSQTKNAELVIQIKSRLSRFAWQVSGSGKTTQKVMRLDKFREQVKDAKGKKQFDIVGASYVAYASGARAEVIVKARVRELGPEGTVLWERQLSESADDKRTYIEWDGDERALSRELQSLGTDRTPPSEPETLARTILDRAAAAIAREILSKLENG